MFSAMILEYLFYEQRFEHWMTLASFLGGTIFAAFFMWADDRYAEKEALQESPSVVE